LGVVGTNGHRGLSLVREELARGQLTKRGQNLILAMQSLSTHRNLASSGISGIEDLSPYNFFAVHARFRAANPTFFRDGKVT